MSPTTPDRPQIAIIGAGVAGLYGALHAASQGATVTLITKGALRASNSFMAQGGVAAAIGAGDSTDLHFADTITAGRGLCDPAAVRVLVDEGVERIFDLERLGVEFDRNADGEYDLGREGGHGHNRILHAGGSATGAAIAERLIARVRAEPRIHVLEHAAAIALICDGRRCGGAWVLHRDELLDVRAPMTLLASGGACALYERTTNPPGATGDGIAIAIAAGAQVARMEFVQFHPTALATGERAFLISEAVRGDGAYLVAEDGYRFMRDLHPDAELAPRDVVASAIHARTQSGQTTYLTLRHLDPAWVRSHFPNLVVGCSEVGLDLTTDLIPVSPAAHYLMGGVATDLQGRSTIPGLYASGECASTGAHGANRLASNSLLECFVFSHRSVSAGLGIERQPVDGDPPARPNVRAPLDELRRRMWLEAGPVRTAAGLERLLAWLDTQTLSNPVSVSTQIARAALARDHSVGSHIRTDEEVACSVLPITG
jgi:L-aspartate oxidase